MTQRWMTKPSALAWSAALVLSATAAGAVETRFWDTSSRGAFEEGELDGVSVDADGVLSLAPRLRELVASESIYFWDVAAHPKGGVVIGTGDDGTVIRVDGDDETLLADLELLEVMAVAVSRAGVVYAGGAPGGVVYAIQPDGTVSPYVDTEQGVVWDLAFDSKGRLLIATGDSGRLLRSDAAGAFEVLYESADPHVMCIEPTPAGDLYFGTAGSGLVCRLDAAGVLDVLYDATEDEIRTILVTEAGAVYVAVNVAPAGEEEKGDGPVVYKLVGRGSADRLWRGDSRYVFDLEEAPGGDVWIAAGEPAVLYRVDPAARRSTRIAELEETNILTLHPEGRRVLVTTSNPARLYALEADHRSSGTVTGRVEDAGAEATWGRVRWTGTVPGGARLAVATRSGNKEEPDDTWSEWRDATGDEEGSFAIDSPPARFLQWRLTLEGGGDVTPVVSEIVTSYREVNLAPRLVALDVSRKGSDLFSNADSRPRSVRRRLPSGIEVDYTLPNDTGGAMPMSPGEANWVLGLRTISWVATDPNGDVITFDLFYRPVESERWLPLAETVEDLVYTWDTSYVPDGEYKIKVVASDGSSNQDGGERTDERISATFEIDNTPPNISRIQATLDGSDIRLEADARDDRSAIVRADVTFDGQTWKPARPAGGLLDARSLWLEVRFDAEDRGPGDSVVLRLVDEAGNQSVRRAFVK